MYRLVALFCVLGFVRGQTTVTQQCRGNSGDLPISLNVAGCADLPCALPQLQNVAFNIVFEAPRDVTNMRTLATAYIFAGGIAIPIAYDLGLQSDTCSYLENADCPIAQGQVVQYTLTTFIESFFPVGLVVDIELHVVDQDSNPVFCARLPVRITSSQ